MLRLRSLCAVVPFVHSGMEQVLPKGSALPKPGQSIRVLVGEPIAVADLQQTAAAEQWPEHVLYAAIADRIGHSLHALKARLEGVPVSEVGHITKLICAVSEAAADVFHVLMMLCAVDLHIPFDNIFLHSSCCGLLGWPIRSHRELKDGWTVVFLSPMRAHAGSAGDWAQADAPGGEPSAPGGAGVHCSQPSPVQEHHSSAV